MFGIGYGIASTTWLLGVLPTEWLDIPTWPKGLLLVAVFWCLTVLVAALPCLVWGRVRASRAAVLSPLIMTMLWMIYPFPLVEPGYLLAYTPLEHAAFYGGVHVLTALLMVYLEILHLTRTGYPWLALWLLPAFFIPVPHLKLNQQVQIFIVQPSVPRSLHPSPKQAVGLLKQTPDGAFVILPESVFHPGERPANWNTLIAHRTVVWGEIRQAGNRLRNSLLIHSPSGLFIYDKQHLAPGAEWLGPPGIDTIVHALTGWIPLQSGTTPSLWHSPYGDVAVAICYESAWAFPTPVAFSLVITNDDWLGSSFRHHRDLIERLRAIETRAPVIRVANRFSTITYPDLPQHLVDHEYVQFPPRFQTILNLKTFLLMQRENVF